jgi:DNA (cytosine-5)-methyltransferase 1
MLRGLDLFSGIGGLSLALSEWVRPVAYCEIDAYARGVLLSRMRSGELAVAPIWDDVSTLAGLRLPPVDIIYGGFPCQDTSLAGNGAGLAGERSGLFFQVVRLAKEIRPTFLFLENVPGLRTRGLSTVIQELSLAGYVGRVEVVSAEEVGAPHRRQRIFILAARADLVTDSSGGVVREQSGRGSRADWEGETLFGVDGAPRFMADPEGRGNERQKESPRQPLFAVRCDAPRMGTRELANADSAVSGRTGVALEGTCREAPEGRPEEFGRRSFGAGRDWWSIEPDVGRVAHGVPRRVDRLRALGNAVVPAQAKEAFERLMGLK